MNDPREWETEPARRSDPRPRLQGGGRLLARQKARRAKRYARRAEKREARAARREQLQRQDVTDQPSTLPTERTR